MQEVCRRRGAVEILKANGFSRRRPRNVPNTKPLTPSRCTRC